jgi:hypothetical protein
VPPGDDDRVSVAPVGREQRDAGQVERGEQVRVPQFGGERHAEEVERAERPVRVDGELRYPMFAHQGFQVGPHRVGALGQDVGLFVEHLVQDLDALVRQPDLVRVRVHQRPADGRGVPVLDHRAEFAADVLDRLADPRQQRLQPAEHGLHTHNIAAYPGVSRTRFPGRVGARTARRTPAR